MIFNARIESLLHYFIEKVEKLKQEQKEGKERKKRGRNENKKNTIGNLSANQCHSPITMCALNHMEWRWNIVWYRLIFI